MRYKLQVKDPSQATNPAFASELQHLSKDPEITKCPDTKMRIGFHAPDEVGEEELAIIGDSSTAQTRRTAVLHPDWRPRRSPKE